MKKILLILASLATLYACKQSKPYTMQEFIVAANIDSSIKPGDDFFRYANGEWLKSASIPSTESGVGSFLDLRNRTREDLKFLLDSVSKTNSEKGSIAQKVGDFYLSGMDSAEIDKRGYEPLKPWLERISAITDPEALMKYIADQQKIQNNLLFNIYVGSDEKNSSKNIMVFYQGGLGLPDRDYYFKSDAATVAVITAYKAYITKLFTLTGDDSTTALKNAGLIFDLEKTMAASHRTNVELRDPESNYHKIAVADFDKKASVLNLKTFLNNIDVKTDSVNISQPAFYIKLNELLTSGPIDTWKLYLRFHTIEHASQSLSSDFVNANFAYYGKALSGQQQIKPRWQRMTASTDNNLGEALGQLYVEKHFTADAKKRMLDLVNNLQKAFEARINKLDWMSDSTKKKAKEKLYTFIKKIGFPDKWKDYSDVEISKTTYFENLESCAKNEFNYQVKKVGKDVDKTEWGMSPPTINAYYNPTFNEIVFPAGILQFPFFDENADDAVNYGGIGMVIGHEMTHGFDDQGAQYDKDGNLKLWWSKEDYAKFTTRSDKEKALYSSFTVLDSMHVNGGLTNGENIADLGGINIAYDAFKLTKQGQDTAKINGFTPDQRFFLSYAQIWRGKQKDETLRQQVNTNPHSPSEWRVNGPLMNFEPFYKAFDVRQGDKMYKPEGERVKIW